MGRPYHTSPADRLPPGTARNPRGANDAVLRSGIGHTTGDIRLTPAAATIVGSAAYNFGKVDDRAIGTYRLEWQAAASADAEPLGAINRVEFTIYESSAGVYTAKINLVADVDGGPAADPGHQVNDAAAGLVSATAVADTKITLAVADSTLIAAYVGVATDAVDVAVGDLILVDASDTGTRVYSLTRLS